MNIKEEIDSWYKFDYKSYFKKLYNLNESPSRIGMLPFGNDTAENNKYDAIRSEENDKYIGIYKYNGMELRHYYTVEEGIIFNNLLAMEQPYVILHHSYREIKLHGKQGVESTSIWQEKLVRGIAQYWIFNDILTKYDFMISDSRHTTRGEIFWSKIIEKALKEKLKCGFVDGKNNDQFTAINDINELDNLYDNPNIRLAIFNS
jgi:hypothetical protein